MISRILLATLVCGGLTLADAAPLAKGASYSTCMQRLEMRRGTAAKTQPRIYRVRKSEPDIDRIQRLAWVFGLDPQRSVERKGAITRLVTPQGRCAGHNGRDGTYFFSDNQARLEPLALGQTADLDKQARWGFEQLIGANADGAYVPVNAGTRVAMLPGSSTPTVIARIYRVGRTIDGRLCDDAAFASLVVNGDGAIVVAEINDPQLEPIRPMRPRKIGVLSGALERYCVGRKRVPHRGAEVTVAEVTVQESRDSYRREVRGGSEYLVPAVSFDIQYSLENGGTSMEQVDIGEDEESTDLPLGRP